MSAPRRRVERVLLLAGVEAVATRVPERAGRARTVRSGSRIPAVIRPRRRDDVDDANEKTHPAGVGTVALSERGSGR